MSTLGIGVPIASLPELAETVAANDQIIVYSVADQTTYRAPATDLTGAILSTANTWTAAQDFASGIVVSAETVTGSLSVEGALALSTPLTVPQGGIGATTLTAHGVLLGHGVAAVTAIAANTAALVLTSNGAGIDPSFQAVAVQPTMPYLSKSANYATASADSGALLEATGTWTLTLTTSGISAGWFLLASNVGSSNTGIACTPATGTIDGLATLNCYPGELRLIEYDGTNFHSKVLTSLSIQVTTAGAGSIVWPPGYSIMTYDMTAGGATGGGGASAGTFGGSAGGGCARKLGQVQAPTAGSTVNFSVGASIAGAAAASDGTPGNPTSITGIDTVFGGGAGTAGATSRSGGGGGGSLGVGTNGTGNTGNVGGGAPGSALQSAIAPGTGVYANGLAGAGAQGSGNQAAAAPAGNAEWGGGGGSFGSGTGAAGGNGGSSYYGGAGGGGGGSSSGTNGGRGGANKAYTTGGGGAVGTGGASPTAGGTGAAGSWAANTSGQGGGGGGGSSGANPGAAGGDGGAPGGGGGGGGASASGTGGAGGAGARGELRIGGL